MALFKNEIIISSFHIYVLHALLSSVSDPGDLPVNKHCEVSLVPEYNINAITVGNTCLTSPLIKTKKWQRDKRKKAKINVKVRSSVDERGHKISSRILSRGCRLRSSEFSTFKQLSDDCFSAL